METLYSMAIIWGILAIAISIFTFNQSKKDLTPIFTIKSLNNIYAVTGIGVSE